MAVPRPLLLALIGALLTFATFVAMRNAADTVDARNGPAKVAAQPAPRVKRSATPKTAASAPAARPKAAAPSKPAAAKPAPAPKPKAKALAGVPPKVSRALQASRTVVLFFRQPGADDVATSQAVDGLRGRKKVTVFKDGIAHLARYRAIVAGLGVTQAPAVVIVGRDRKAQLVEGFIDEGTLVQQVVDAR